MASIGGVSGNNTTSSLYNSANVISGLASGLDTEGMIEGLVQSYQNKIQTLNNKATKLEWKQEAYRSIITKMNAFANKYTSYSSSTNLMSASFFNNAIKVAAQGKYADKVTASGRTDSDIKLNKVTQLATAARYSTKSELDIGSDFAVSAESGVKFDDTVEMGTLSGSLTLNYGNKTVSVVFDPNTDIIADNVYKTNDNGSYVLDDKGQKIVERKRTSSEKAADLQKIIEKKLGDQKITLSTGETKDASEMIDVKADATGKITFSDKTTARNSVYLSGASGTVESVLGLDLDDASEKKLDNFQVSASTRLTQEPTVASLISGKTMNISLDGRSKTIYLPEVTKDGDGYTLAAATVGKDKDGRTTVTYGDKKPVKAEDYAETYRSMVEDAIQKEFGQKITVKNLGEKDDKGITSLKLSIEAPKNSSMVINSDAGKALGIGSIATNYLNTGKTLGELTKKNPIDWDKMTKAKDEKGEVLKDKDGKDLYEFVINGKKIGNYNEDSKLSDIISDINNSDAGVKLSYSQTTRTFTFTSKDTGAENEISIEGGLAEAIFGSSKFSERSTGTFGEAYGVSWLNGEKVNFKFPEAGGSYSLEVGKDDKIEDVAEKLNGLIFNHGCTAAYNKYTGELEITNNKSGAKVDLEMWIDDSMLGRVDLELQKGFAPEINYTPGQDAKFQVEVNGQTLDMTRATNSANIDGLTINFKSTFDAEEGDEVTFQTSTDSDKIVDAVKSMIADYNEMMSEIRGQYATLPYQSSNGSFKTYEPLSDEDKATMSESAIQKYEEKAKQGLLFNDSNLSTLYDRMRSVFSPGGADEALLRQMGITTTYSSTDGSSSIVLDESKLREMLDSDPDAVADLFTRSSGTGASSNGIMQGMKVQLDRYAGITGATKGILVQQAGTPLSSLTLMNNSWQNQIDDIYTDVEKWQDKLSAQVDKYTSMFSKLETLIYQMNSQSSTLAGLMGG